jgi:hypothetical protein
MKICAVFSAKVFDALDAIVRGPRHQIHGTQHAVLRGSTERAGDKASRGWHRRHQRCCGLCYARVHLQARVRMLTPEEHEAHGRTGHRHAEETPQAQDCLIERSQFRRRDRLLEEDEQLEKCYISQHLFTSTFFLSGEAGCKSSLGTSSFGLYANLCNALSFSWPSSFLLTSARSENCLKRCERR